MKTEEEKRAFLEELAAVYNKHGMRLYSCGCCGGISVDEPGEHEDRWPATADNIEGA